MLETHGIVLKDVGGESDEEFPEAERYFITSETPEKEFC